MQCVHVAEIHKCSGNNNECDDQKQKQARDLRNKMLLQRLILLSASTLCC